MSWWGPFAQVIITQFSRRCLRRRTIKDTHHVAQPTTKACAHLLYMQYYSPVFIVYFWSKRCRWLIYCLLCRVSGLPANNQSTIDAPDFGQAESHTHHQGVTPALDLNALSLTRDAARATQWSVAARHLPLRLRPAPTVHSQDEKRRRQKMCFYCRKTLCRLLMNTVLVLCAQLWNFSII